MTTFLTAACLTLAAIAFAVVLWLACKLYGLVLKTQEREGQLYGAIANLASLQSPAVKLTLRIDERVEELESEWEPDDTDLDDEDEDSDDDLSDDETPLYDPNARMTFKPRDPDKWKYQ